MAASWPVLIFLDIDGVLNGREFLAEAKLCKINPECVRNLNRIMTATDARVVLSSAWRYMIHGHAMTLDGFHYLLRTHGMLGSLNRQDKLIIDLTCRDEDILERPDQIRAWLRSNGHRGDQRYVVLDDLDADWGELNIVQIDDRVGLTEADADRAIAMLAPTEDEPETPMTVLSPSEEYEAFRQWRDSRETPAVPKSLGETLKAKRSELGLTLRKMAGLTGLSNPYLSQIETGFVTNPSGRAIQKISAGYGIPIDQIIGLCISKKD
jgi:DNA-binding XRE family transcriptional regulator